MYMLAKNVNMFLLQQCVNKFFFNVRAAPPRCPRWHPPSPYTVPPKYRDLRANARIGLTSEHLPAWCECMSFRNWHVHEIQAATNPYATALDILLPEIPVAAIDILRDPIYGMYRISARRYNAYNVHEFLAKILKALNLMSISTCTGRD